MLRRSFLVFGVLCAALLIGCGKTETTNNSNSMAMDGNKNTSTTTTTTTTSSTTSSDEKIGIQECDDFIAKYDACLTKVPEMVRGPFKNALTEWRKSWKELAKDPANREKLTTACKQAAEQQASALKAYGCNF